MHLRFRYPRRSHVAPNVVVTKDSINEGRFLVIYQGWPDPGKLLLSLENALLVSLPVPVFVRCPLVVKLLAFGQADLDLDPSLLPVERGWDEGKAFSLDQTDQFVQFVAVQQQFTGAQRVWIDMGGCGG